MVDQLVRIYLEEEKWHKTKLSEEEAEKYYKTLLQTGNIVCHTDKEGVVLGYIEFFCVTLEQFGRLSRQGKFHIGEEDIVNGNICWLSDLWIDKDCRLKDVYKIIKKKLFNATKQCIYYTGLEVKRGRRLRIHRRKYGE